MIIPIIPPAIANTGRVAQQTNDISHPLINPIQNPPMVLKIVIIKVGIFSPIAP